MIVAVSKCAPSRLRQPLKEWQVGIRSPKSLLVIDLLASGSSRLEAARAVGLDKANVRVIELRARRRGLLAGIETRVDPTSPCARPMAGIDPAAPRPAAPATPSAVYREHGDRDRGRAARIRMARAAGRTLRDIGVEHGIRARRVSQILARTAGRP